MGEFNFSPAEWVKLCELAEPIEKKYRAEGRPFPVTDSLLEAIKRDFNETKPVFNETFNETNNETQAPVSLKLIKTSADRVRAWRAKKTKSACQLTIKKPI